LKRRKRRQRRPKPPNFLLYLYPSPLRPKAPQEGLGQEVRKMVIGEEKITFELVENEEALKKKIVEEHKEEAKRYTLLLFADTIARRLAEDHDVELQRVSFNSLEFTVFPPVNLLEFTVLAKKEGYEYEWRGDFVLLESDYGIFEVTIGGKVVNIRVVEWGRFYHEEAKRIETETSMKRGDFVVYNKSLIRLTNVIKLPRYAPRSFPLLFVGTRKEQNRFYVDEKSTVEMRTREASLKISFEKPCIISFSS